MAIRFGKGDWPNLVCDPLLVLYGQPIYPKSFAEIYDFLDPESVSKAPQIHDDSFPNAWHRWYQGSGRQPAEPERVYHFSEYTAAIEAAKSLGGAIAVMPLESQLVRDDVVITPFPPWRPLEEKIYAVYRPADRENLLISEFIFWVRSLLDSLNTDE